MINKAAVFINKNFSGTHLVVNGRIKKALSYWRRLHKKNVKIISYENNVKMAHNGCRPPKKRRV